MKKKILIILCLISLFYPSSIYARAGGGSSGASASSGSSYRNHNHGSSSNNSLVNFMNCVLVITLSCSTIIIVKVKLTKSKLKTKKKMKKTTWNYTEIGKRIEKAYFVIQNAWANNDMSPAKDYMTYELFENFKIKLDWMEIANKRNILKKIKLLDIYPVSLNDDIDDSKDNIWVYIKGKMIDYTIDIKTNEIIDGSTTNKSFVEYWLFVKDEDGKWVLSKILQENEIDQVPLEK